MGAPMSVSLRVARRATATALAVSVAAVALVTSACTPAQVHGTKVISGTVQGADGNIVDVLIGFDVIDGAGHKLNLGGGNVGYSAIQRLNHCVGTARRHRLADVRQRRTTQITGYNWSITVSRQAPRPSTSRSTRRLRRRPTGSTTTAATPVSPPAPPTPAPTRPPTSGRSRWQARAAASRSCCPRSAALSGGTTGSLYGHIAGWPSGNTGKVNAWSMAPNWLPTQGFATGTVDANGNYRIDGLQAGQRYGLIASAGGFSRNVVNYTNSNTNDTLVPSACSQKNYNFTNATTHSTSQETARR